MCRPKQPAHHVSCMGTKLKFDEAVLEGDEVTFRKRSSILHPFSLSPCLSLSHILSHWLCVSSIMSCTAQAVSTKMALALLHQEYATCNSTTLCNNTISLTLCLFILFSGGLQATANFSDNRCFWWAAVGDGESEVRWLHAAVLLWDRYYSTYTTGVGWCQILCQ